MPRFAQAQQGPTDPPPYRPRKVGPPGPGGEAGATDQAPSKRPSRWLDRIIGVALGLVLGIAVIIVFVFYGSEGTIDAPRISGVDTGKPGTGQPKSGLPLGGPALAPLVRVIGGAPPPSGPVALHFRQGGAARFVVGSDGPVGIEIPGYGVSRSVGEGRTTVAFRASKAGQYPVVVSVSHIAVATMHVTPR